MFILGVILLVLGLVLGFPLLLWLGVVLLVLGLVLGLAYYSGRGVGGRLWY
jgi:hypothetical protein